MKKRTALAGVLTLIAGSAVVGISATPALADGGYQVGAACNITIAHWLTGNLVSVPGTVSPNGQDCQPNVWSDLPVPTGEGFGISLTCGTNLVGELVITCPKA